MSLDRLDVLRHRATSIPLPDSVRDLGRSWAEKLNFSPRREAKIAWAVRCHAALREAERCEHADLLAVIPSASSLAEDLAGSQQQIREDLEAEVRRIEGERQQAADITSIVDGVSGEGIDEAKSLASAIRRLRRIECVSDEIGDMRDEAVKNLSRRHADRLRAMEVLA